VQTVTPSEANSPDRRGQGPAHHRSITGTHVFLTRVKVSLEAFRDSSHIYAIS